MFLQEVFQAAVLFISLYAGQDFVGVVLFRPFLLQQLVQVHSSEGACLACL